MTLKLRKGHRQIKVSDNGFTSKPNNRSIGFVPIKICRCDKYNGDVLEIFDSKNLAIKWVISTYFTPHKEYEKLYYKKYRRPVQRQIDDCLDGKIDECFGFGWRYLEEVRNE